jgi:hypothetical protein
MVYYTECKPQEKEEYESEEDVVMDKGEKIIIYGQI